MTLHSAKGLEFPVVVVAGLEDGILPHFNSGGASEDIEEERRLLYVGMTRARERLFLTCCRRRRIAGRYQDQSESPFLEELPMELVDLETSPSLFVSDRTRSVYSYFERDREVDDLPVWREPTVASATSTTRLRRGARVRHAHLGEGTVIGVEGDGEMMKITVYFEKAGKRKLVAKYAGLEAV